MASVRTRSLSRPTSPPPPPVVRTRFTALLRPLKVYQPPRCPAPPRIFPNGTSEVSRLCSPYRRMLGTRRFCLNRSYANVLWSDAALFRMTSLAESAVWSGSTSLMKRSSAKPLHEPSTFIPHMGAASIMSGGVWWFSFHRLKVVGGDT